MTTGISATGLLWCGLFFLLGPALILLNNHILNRAHFRHPILVSSLGMFGAVCVCQLGRLFGIFDIKKNISINFWWSRVLPIGLLSAATMGTGNSVYLHLSVSFTQMLKALTPVYILLCLVLFKVEIPTRYVVYAVTIISIGTMIASFGEINFSWIGFTLQSFADLLEGSRLVLLQLVLSHHGLTPIESLYYLSPATALSQLVLVLIYERNAFTSANWTLVMDNKHLFLAAMALGIGINFIGMFVIKHTSGLMLKLIGVVRNNALVLFSVAFLNEPTTFLQMAGYTVSIAGFVWYANLTHGGQSEPIPISKYAHLHDDEDNGEEMGSL